MTEQTDKPNILFLSVDSFRADRLGLYGYERPTSPNMDAFAKDAIVCENAYTLGPFTQLACIQLFTSSRPLSYGGYDQGAANRPDTLFKHFHDAGYRTWGLSTIHWVSPYYGYTDGLDTELSVFHLNTLVGMAVMNTRDTIRLYVNGEIKEDRMLATVVPVIRKLFDNVDHYCDMLASRHDEYARDFPYAKIVGDAYDLTKVKKVAGRHRIEFEANHAAYIDKNLASPPEAHGWLAYDWRLCRRPMKLIREAWLRLSNKVVRKFSDRLAGERENKYRYSVDAHAIADRVSNELTSLANTTKDKPFFLWAHFKDNHQPYVSGHGGQWFKDTPRYLSDLGYSSDIDPTIVFRKKPKTDADYAEVSALYDASIRSVDEAIGNILASLSENGLADNTIVCICGDHGEEINDHGDYGHLCLQYEHNARIPLMFRIPGQPGRRSQDLVTSMDLSPTLSAAAGLAPAQGWEGVSVTDESISARPHVLMENFCRGNCEIEHRPIYMAIRTPQYKYLWREGVDLYHKVGKPEPSLFDLQVDPFERNDIYRPDHPEILKMNRIIAQRLKEIDEVSDARIEGLFGDSLNAAEGNVR